MQSALDILWQWAVQILISSSSSSLSSSYYHSLCPCLGSLILWILCICHASSLLWSAPSSYGISSLLHLLVESCTTPGENYFSSVCHILPVYFEMMMKMMSYSRCSSRRRKRSWWFYASIVNVSRAKPTGSCSTTSSTVTMPNLTSSGTSRSVALVFYLCCSVFKGSYTFSCISS